MATAPAPAASRLDPLSVGAGIGLIVGLILFLAFAPFGLFVAKALHILAATVWVGGNASFTILALRAQRARDLGELQVIGKLVEWIGTRIFTPASFIVLALGILLVVKYDYGWGHFWVLFALLGWAASAATGVLYLGPTSGRLSKLVETKGPDDPEVRETLAQLLAVARVDAVLLVLIVVDMAAKPFS